MVPAQAQAFPPHVVLTVLYCLSCFTRPLGSKRAEAGAASRICQTRGRSEAGGGGADDLPQVPA